MAMKQDPHPAGMQPTNKPISRKTSVIPEAEIAELRNKIEAVEKIVEGIAKEQTESTKGLRDLREVAPTLLKAHQTVLESQKKAQNAFSKAEEGRVMLEETKNAAKNLVEEIKRLTCSERDCRVEEYKVKIEDIRILELDLARLEKKLELILQEVDTHTTGELAKLSIEMANQAEGYKSFLISLISTQMTMPEIEKCKVELANLKQINKQGKLGTNSSDINLFIKSSAEEMVKKFLNSESTEANKFLVELDRIQQALSTSSNSPLKTESISSTTENSQLNSFFDSIQEDIQEYNDDFEHEINLQEEDLTNRTLHYYELKNGENEGDQIKKEVTTLFNSMPSLDPLKKKFQDFKSKSGNALGKLSRVYHEMSSKKPTLTDKLLVSLKTKRTALETRIKQIDNYFEKKIAQLEVRIEATLQLVQQDLSKL